MRIASIVPGSTALPLPGPPPLARVLPLTLCLLLGACGLTRPPARIDAATPTQWNAPLPTTSKAPTTPAVEPGVPPSALPHGGSTTALATWWRQFDDPALATDRKSVV